MLIFVDRQTDIQKERQTEKQTDRQTDRQTLMNKSQTGLDWLGLDC